MRPLALSERVDGESISLGGLLEGARPPISGRTSLALEDYVEELLASGLPGVRPLSGRARRLQLEGYLERIVDRDIPDDAGVAIRNPAALRRWMAAYAAASSTTASFETIRDAASAGHESKQSRNATQAYRDALTRVWVLDEVPAWIPSNNRLRELGHTPKHQLADPALVAQLWVCGRTRSSRVAALARSSRVTARCSVRCSKAWRRSPCAYTRPTTRPASSTFALRADARKSI